MLIACVSKDDMPRRPGFSGFAGDFSFYRIPSRGEPGAAGLDGQARHVSDRGRRRTACRGRPLFVGRRQAGAIQGKALNGWQRCSRFAKAFPARGAGREAELPCLFGL